MANLNYEWYFSCPKASKRFVSGYIFTVEKVQGISIFPGRCFHIASAFKVFGYFPLILYKTITVENLFVRRFSHVLGECSLNNNKESTRVLTATRFREDTPSFLFWDADSARQCASKKSAWTISMTPDSAWRCRSDKISFWVECYLMFLTHLETKNASLVALLIEVLYKR